MRGAKTQTENFLDRLSRLLDWNRALNIVARIKRMANKTDFGPHHCNRKRFSFFCTHQDSPMRDMEKRVQVA